MGRAHNSFTSYVGHAEETINDEKVTVESLSAALLAKLKGDITHLIQTKAAEEQQNVMEV